jgi:2-polyprenyl-3-methyl-5-hydroxy-6-metoxy-1,4-benzoquinol methylase
MGENVWNTAQEYLEKSRRIWWNNDYMEFLVEKVLRITTPVSIIDFGCGLGFLGELLLPLLPVGSSYTGVDAADNLLEHAATRFQNSGYDTCFIQADLNEYTPKKKYDIAICQTVLQHISNPLNILKKMKDSVKTNGMVICIELSRDVAAAALFIDGLDYSRFNLLGIEQKVRRNDLDRFGKDYEIALKLPVYMEKIGLKNVSTRVNDYMQFISPSKEEYKSELEAFMAGPYGNKIPLESKKQFVNSLIRRGLSHMEAVHEFECRKMISDYLHEHQENIQIVGCNCMFISYGYNKDS